MEANSPDMLLKSCLQYMSCACVTFFTRLALTQAGSSGTRRESPNFRSNSTCSMMRIAASPGSIFHLPSWSYKHTKSAEFVHIDITTRNWNTQDRNQISAARSKYFLVFSYYPNELPAICLTKLQLLQQHEEEVFGVWPIALKHLFLSPLHCSVYIHILMFFLRNRKIQKLKMKLRENVLTLTTAARAKARGKAQANIMIIPNCKASSRESANANFNFKLLAEKLTSEHNQSPKDHWLHKSLLPSKSPSSSSTPMLAEYVGLKYSFSTLEAICILPVDGPPSLFFFFLEKKKADSTLLKEFWPYLHKWNKGRT